VRDLEESHCCSTVCSDIIVNRPLLVVVVFVAFIVWLVCLILSERVGNAFAEDFVSVLWSVWPLRTWNHVREAKIREKSWEVVSVLPNRCESRS